MDIMVLHDGSKRGQEALELAVDYFKVLKPEITLLCVEDHAGDASMEVDAITEEYERELKGIMRDAAEWVTSQNLEVSVVQAVGDPRKMILETINKKSPDIVIVARRAKSAIEGVFRRSVSAYLVKNASCHLFIMGNT